MALDEPARTGWTFVTNHARVLAAIARDPGVRLRDVAVEVQLTERAVQAIVTDLEQAGYLTRSRAGRRNRYRIASGTWLRHPAETGLSVAALLDLLAPAYRAAEGTTGEGEPDRGDAR
ncbi:helix-turn-helix transcriptional regulator [Kitasatospora sp. NPDC059327]|uniref:helix-turn-helix transcriptional regulator n=1 Tax=Kitasatospora sp. NPDC059327 TaxID=3346803 RepID=UPI0036CC29D9